MFFREDLRKMNIRELNPEKLIKTAKSIRFKKGEID